MVDTEKREEIIIHDLENVYHFWCDDCKTEFTIDNIQDCIAALKEHYNSTGHKRTNLIHMQRYQQGKERISDTRPIAIDPEKS